MSQDLTFRIRSAVTLTLRKKTLTIVAATFIGLIAVLYFALSSIMMNSFEQVEDMDVRADIQRFREALTNSLDGTRLVAEDYAQWDVTYDFVREPNEEYIRLYLTDLTFSDARLNLVLYVDAEGRRVFGTGFDLESGTRTPVPESVISHLSPGGPLLGHSDEGEGLRGLLWLDEGPMLVVSEYIQSSLGSGPRAGSLILGRYLDDAEVARLADLTLLSLTVHRYSDDAVPEDFTAARSSLSPESPTVVRSLNDDVVGGYTMLEDVYGTPILLVRADMARDVIDRGRDALEYLLIALVAVGLVLVVVIGLLLDKLVVSRVSRLNSEVSDIRSTTDLSARVETGDADELSNLGGAINGMLEGLEDAHDREAEYLAQIEAERENSERLLLNILPMPIAERLNRGESTIADSFAEVSVLFADVVDFTRLSAQTSPSDLVHLLNRVFSAFDGLSEKHGLEKIKTIGDAYMVVGGLPSPREDHAEAIADMAMDMQVELAKLNADMGQAIGLRVGINTGPVVAGVIGTKKFIYDLWGDAVNTASRMESSGVQGSIQVTEATYEKLRDKYAFEARGTIEIKGKGPMMTYFLKGRKVEVGSMAVLADSEA